MCSDSAGKQFEINVYLLYVSSLSTGLMFHGDKNVLVMAWISSDFVSDALNLVCLFPESNTRIYKLVTTYC